MRTGDEDTAADKKKSEEEDSVKIAAFLWIRKVILTSDPALKDVCLKVLSTMTCVELDRIRSVR